MWYIGGVPSGLIIRPGVQAAKSPGFQGCIRDIEFNEVLVKANGRSEESTVIVSFKIKIKI